MASRKQPDSAPEERLGANRRTLELLAAACGEEAGLHRPLNEIVGGLFYHNYCSGTGLMSGATFGRLAGESAALWAAQGRRGVAAG